MGIRSFVLLFGALQLSVPTTQAGPGLLDKITQGGKTIACEGRAGAGGPVEVTYLGVGGVLLRRGNDVVMTAPFYSNPSMVEVGLADAKLDKLRSREDLVERLLPQVEDVKAILVGHSHYDHLMDIPYIARVRAPQALIYGNKTMTHILAAPEAGLERGRLVALDDKAGTHERLGDWVHIPGARIRVMALKSEHAPHSYGVKLYGGEVTRDLARLPDDAWGWKEGRTLAFLIDFLGEDGVTPEFRIHYQDAASNPPLGLPPQAELKVPTDLAVLCVASFHEVERYPEGVLDVVKPRHALLGHWENFFRPQTEPLEPVPMTDVLAFVKRLSRTLPPDSGWTLPAPGTTLRMDACGVR